MSKVVEFTHATLGIKVSINTDNLFGYYFSESVKATLLLSTGTAVIPVRESTSQVASLVKSVELDASKYEGQPLK